MDCGMVSASRTSSGQILRIIHEEVREDSAVVRAKKCCYHRESLGHFLKDCPSNQVQSAVEATSPNNKPAGLDKGKTADDDKTAKSKTCDHCPNRHLSADYSPSKCTKAFCFNCFPPGHIMVQCPKAPRKTTGAEAGADHAFVVDGEKVALNAQRRREMMAGTYISDDHRALFEFLGPLSRRRKPRDGRTA
jgi:hypothetical protein